MGQGKIFWPGLVMLAVFGFPWKSQIFNFFPLGQKISQGRAKKYPGQSWIDILFTVGQKYAFWFNSLSLYHCDKETFIFILWCKSLAHLSQSTNSLSNHFVSNQLSQKQ